jgi:transcriptional regulator with XRE-family HTH domain
MAVRLETYQAGPNERIVSGRYCSRSRKPWRPTVESDRPFGEALRALMDERGLTYRSLAAATREADGRGMTHAHINMLANGHDRPSMRAMELIAKVCEIQPAYFAEYRLATAMRALDPAEVGLEQALENLNARLGARRTSAAIGRLRQEPQARPRPSG